MSVRVKNEKQRSREKKCSTTNNLTNFEIVFEFEVKASKQTIENVGNEKL